MKFFGNILKKITNLKASTSTIKKFFNSIFKNDASTKKLNSGSSSNTGYTTVNDDLKNSIDTISKLVNQISVDRYNTISGENQLMGNLFPKLINETNEIIEEANKNRKEYINNFE